MYNIYVFQNTSTHFLSLGLLCKASLLNHVVVFIHALYICLTVQSAKLAK